MNQQDYTGYIYSTSEQVQFGIGQAQPSGGQSSSTDAAIQMLLIKNKRKVENKPVDKEEQKREAEEDPLESIRRFNQINEEIKKSYDEYASYTKHREKNMRQFMLKAEAIYLKDEDREQSRDRESSRDRDKESDSSDEDVYSKKSKTNSIKLRCEECDDEITQKNYGRHIHSLKHKKNDRLYNSNKIIEDADESVKKVTNEDIEQIWINSIHN